MLSGCTTTIQLEQCTGSPGSDCAHWAENVFGFEILSTSGGVDTSIEEPVSMLTIAGMQDLGYTVDYGVAEEYTLPDNQKCNTLPCPDGGRKLSQAQEEVRANAVKHGKDVLSGVASSVEGRNLQLSVVSVMYLDPDSGKAVSILVRGDDP